MNCPKCATEIADSSLFCNHCGAKVAAAPKKSGSKKLLWSLIGGGGVIIIAALLFIFLQDNAVGALKKAMNNHDLAAATEIYEEKIRGDIAKETDAEEIFKEAVKTIQDDFLSEKIAYSQANSSLEGIKKLRSWNPETDKALEKIESLHKSRTAFKKGEEMLAQKNIKGALTNLKKVTEDDKTNFEKAAQLIKDTSAEYKTVILTDAESLATAKKYKEALELISEGAQILPGDANLTAKQKTYQKQLDEQKEAERRKKMAEAKAKQEITVESTKILIQDTRSSYKLIYPDMLNVIVKNNSSKIVKQMDVGMLGYDVNGLPIKLKGNISRSDGEYEYIGNAEDVNLLPKTTFGQNRGWEIDETVKVKTLLACVKSAEFYDGTTWENEYYDYWLEEHLEKPLKQ